MTYGTTGYRICLSRDQLEGLVNYLVDKYPQAFFKNQTLKRPLKKNIVLDLEKDRVLDDDRREAAIRFYTRDWNYENALVPGAKRIDLNGQEVGTVTEQEHLEAKARVVAQRRERRERANELARAMGPIAVTRSCMTKAGYQPTCWARFPPLLRLTFILEHNHRRNRRRRSAAAWT
jgi:sRNA-binding protein